MKSSGLFPFSRNRYYKGKMLTSADFESEQLYMNGKRQFLNRMITGSGIVCGLNVISLDDLSFMVESGMAIDDRGREIVVDSSVVKKLSAIDGFESLETGKACLCIRYQENETQPVYAISRQDTDREFEYNRIDDGYELFLCDVSKWEEEYEAETEFYTGGVLYEDQDYRVQLRLPFYICAGYYVKLEVWADKISDAGTALSYEAILQTPALTTPEGGQELAVSLDGAQMKKGSRMVKEYWMLAQTEVCEDSCVMVKAGSANVVTDDAKRPVQTGISYKLHILKITPELLAAREINRVNLELQSAGGGTGVIRLADITMVRTEAAYLIENVDESVRKYIPTGASEWRRLAYAGCFFRQYPFLKDRTVRRDELTEKEPERGLFQKMPRIATGMVEIPIGDHAKKGDICYSDEIMHGLGAGNVYVEVGYEYLEENALLERMTKTTIYGESDLFGSDGQKAAAESAVKVYNDKGSFVVGLKLKANIDRIVLNYRWVAVRCDSDRTVDEMETDSAQSISVVTPTVILGVRERYFFQVEYHNMKPCSVSYALTEYDGGEVSSDGIYTAPSREGVFEIRIYCTDRPAIHTYAYAIVKRKAVEETHDLSVG